MSCELLQQALDALEFPHDSEWSNKAKAIEHLGGKCKRCNIKSEYHDIYDFHHRDPNEKEAEPSKLMYGNWNNIIKEIDKCDLLCSNCHKITHWELRNKLKIPDR